MILSCCIILAVLVASLHSVSADSATYQIVEESVLVELNMQNAVGLKIELPYDSKAVETNADYFLNESIISLTGKNVTLKYITKTLVEKSSKRYFFIAHNPLPEKQISIKLYLPDSAVLAKDKNLIVMPSPGSVITDGRKIILEWNNFQEKDIIVAYEFLEKSDMIFYVIISALIAAFIVLYVFQSKKFMKKVLEAKWKKGKKITREKNKIVKAGELTRNLYEDEKRIVEYLLNKRDNESWTKEIVRDLGISKVTLSRKLRALEQKQLIKKVPYGNENRIKLLKYNP